MLGVDICPYCSHAINIESSIASSVLLRKVTEACAEANNLKLGTTLAIVFTLINTFLLYNHSVSSMMVTAQAIPFFGLVSVIKWNRNYSKLKTEDNDYLMAKIAMKKVLITWLVAIVIQALSLLLFFSTRTILKPN